MNLFISSHSAFFCHQIPELYVPPVHLLLSRCSCIFLVWSSGVGLSGADEQLVPADHSLPHVHLVEPDVGFPYQGLLHELSSIRHQEKLEVRWSEKKNTDLLVCYCLLYVSASSGHAHNPFYKMHR